MRNLWPSLLLLSCLAALWSTSGCSSSCDETHSCGAYVPAAGSSGESGESGHPNGGASGKSGGSGDSGEANGGSAGSSGGSPCEDRCEGATPVCDAETNACVACVSASDCAGATPVCDTAAHECVECSQSDDCADGPKPLCDEAAHACVACLAPSDCPEASASQCKAGACAACTSNADCAHLAGKGVCDAGTCVECTGKDASACGQSAGTPLVCDSLKRTCTTNKQRSSGLCLACVSDAQCALGQLCVLDKYGSPSQDVGYFCHWQQGDTANGAPADCTAGGQPYVGVQKNTVSIDGTPGDICGLAVSTCTARNQFRAKDCAVANAPSDALCGVSPLKDAKCAQFGVSTYRCTMTCGSDDDCPSPFKCNTAVSPTVCNLN